MISEKQIERIAILGGGPSALFVYKRFVETGRTDLEIHIHESKQLLGAGMPYSFDGANLEHITNVSGNEVPEIVNSIQQWIQTVPEGILTGFAIDKNRFNEYKVLPRLLFGQYLSGQFTLLLEQAERQGLKTVVHLSSSVVDIIDQLEHNMVQVQINGGGLHDYERVIVCTGHNWPIKNEGLIPGYFDSPYPPSKLRLALDHPVAIRGSSLTAIDAVRTLARSNGHFEIAGDGKMGYIPAAGSENFKMVLHSRSGMLPAIRFHLEEPLLSSDSLLTKQELTKQMAENDGFVSLDYIFEKGFKDLIKDKDSNLYVLIKDMDMEEFVGLMMERREKDEPFTLFQAEYVQAEQSIKKQESIHWKEVLAILSFVLNYPAKYLPAEDMIRMQNILLPLISIVIAFVPQNSAQELLALHAAGKLEIIDVGNDSEVEPKEDGGVMYHYKDENGITNDTYYSTFVDSIGQPHLNLNNMPFKSLISKKTVSSARIRFRCKHQGQIMMEKEPEKVELEIDGTYYLIVSGITINDNYQIVGNDAAANERIYMMSVPYIGGYNPDYSGLDFCEQASSRIVDHVTRSPTFDNVTNVVNGQCA